MLTAAAAGLSLFFPDLERLEECGHRDRERDQIDVYVSIPSDNGSERG